VVTGKTRCTRTPSPAGADPKLYCTTAATIHYGRGVAHAAKGQLPQAHAEREAFIEAYDRIPESRYLFNNTSRDILAVAGAMLDGEIAYRKVNSIWRSVIFGAQWNSTTHLPATSRGAGCSPRATPTARCCSRGQRINVFNECFRHDPIVPTPVWP
jgi:hypothetical protein